MERYYLMAEGSDRPNFERAASAFLKAYDNPLDWMLQNYEYKHNSTIVLGVF